jgi:2-keto-4-pentenoate hydratase/2-oxohepta-3-ene-1,7-dioic acid hydratase in catechol pathway
MDWEVELAAVIGRKARGLTLANALSCVAGYTVGNDLSARDLGNRPQVPAGSPFRMDWTAHKSFAGSCPLGPFMTPASDIPDPQKLGLKLIVNDVVKQDSNTSQMIYTLAEQLVQLSHRATLYPGDIVMTGTPAGTAAAHGHYLKTGDVVKAWVEGIGSLTTKIG